MFTVEIETSSGRSFRWAPDSPRIENRARLGPWSTQLADGFGQSTVELSRRPDLDWPDLGRLDIVRYIDDQGRIVYEGRIFKVERSTGNNFQVETVGWSTYLRQRPFTEIYVDRDLGNWHEPPLDERERLASAGHVYGEHYAVESGTRSVHFTGTSGYTGNATAIPSNSQVQLWYTAPSSRTCAQFTYSGDEDNAANVDSPNIETTDDEDLSGSTSYGLTLDDALHDRTITVPKRNVVLRAKAGSDHLKSANPFHRIVKKVAVYGDHGLSLATISGQPDGVTASDVIDDILSRFAPKMALETPGTTYPIGHLAFLEPTTPYDAIVHCNEFHHWNLNVYEGPTLYFTPIDLSTADWHVRADWEGVEITEGEDSDEFVTGVPVTYEDIETGITETLWPDENEELRDDSEENPANKWGEDKWAEPFSIPFPCTAADALQLGSEQLLDLNTPKHPTSLTIPTKLKDAQGNWQPASLVRSGQTITVDTHPQLGTMLVTSTSFDPQSNSVDIGTDYEIGTMDVFFARLDAARAGRF